MTPGFPLGVNFALLFPAVHSADRAPSLGSLLHMLCPRDENVSNEDDKEGSN